MDIDKLKGFASDGASVIGWHNGEAAQLKSCSPSLISIHCVNQRLTLAGTHAADNIPYLQHFKSNLHNLFSSYQNSPVRLDDPKIKLKEAKDVRRYCHNKFASNHTLCDHKFRSRGL